MNKSIFNFSISLLFFVLAFFNSAMAQDKVEVKPKKFVGVVHMSSESDFVYYALSEKKKTVLALNGPGKLIVYNRVRLEDKGSKSKPYYLKYTIDKKRIKTKKIDAKPISTKVKYKSSKLIGLPSKADKEVIIIPPGKHTVSFYKYKTQQKAHVRFVYQKTKKQQWKELTSNYLNQVQLQHVISKKENTYTRIDNKSGVSIPTTNTNSKVRVYLRADFDYKMHTENIIRLELKQNGKLLKTYKVTCKKSKKVENLTDKKLIPGSLEKLYIDIPSHSKGQVLELSIKDKTKSALVRVFLNEEVETKIAM